MISLGISLLLSAHLLAVNVAAGAPLIAAWLDWRGARGDGDAGRAARHLARWSVAGLLTGALLGLIIGWLKWNAAYRSLWTGPLRYKMHWGGIEVLFSFVLLVAWWLCLPRSTPRSRAAALGRGAMALLASTNLLYHFPALFSVAAHLFDAGQTSGPEIRGAAFRRLMAADETPALAVHVGLASVAVAGIVLLGLALRSQRRGEEAVARRIATWGGRWALGASLVQLPVGLWTLMTLSPAAQMQLMGADATGMLLLIASLLAALWLINELVHVATGEYSRGALVRTMSALLVTVVLMTAMQQQTRAVSAPHGHFPSGAEP